MRFVSDKVLARKISIALIVVAVLVIVFMFAEHSPGARRIRVLKNRCERLEEQTHLLVTVDLPQKQGEMSLASDVDTLWEKFRSPHEILLNKIPIAAEQGDFLNTICQIAKADEFEIVSMKSGDIDICKGFSTIQILVDIRCRFEKLGEFLKSIEDMERLVRVDRFEIRSDEFRTGVVVASLVITGYIRPDNL